MKFPGFTFVLLSMILLLPEVAVAERFSGKFGAIVDDTRYELMMYRNSSGKYEGKLTINDKIFVLNAIKLGEAIGGQVAGLDQQYSFIARMAGPDILMQFEEGKLVRFKPL